MVKFIFKIKFLIKEVKRDEYNGDIAIIFICKQKIYKNNRRNTDGSEVKGTNNEGNSYILGNT